MHLLNSSELGILGRIPNIVRAGVSSIRIEVRAVEPERAGAITRLYRGLRLMDALRGMAGFEVRAKV